MLRATWCGKFRRRSSVEGMVEQLGNKGAPTWLLLELCAVALDVHWVSVRAAVAASGARSTSRSTSGVAALCAALWTAILG